MIAAFVPSLLDRSRFGSTDVRFVDRAAEAVDAALVLVDLDRCDDIGAFASLAGHTIGFGSHVDAARLATATDAGFDDVWPRSVFFRRLPELIDQDAG